MVGPVVHVNVVPGITEGIGFVCGTGGASQVLHQPRKPSCFCAVRWHNVQEILVSVAVNDIAVSVQNPGVQALNGLFCLVASTDPDGNAHEGVVGNVLVLQGIEVLQDPSGELGWDAAVEPYIVGV